MAETTNVILCVDDEKIILDSLRAQLMSNLGDRFLYEFSESAEEGIMLINKCKEENLNLHTVITDWLMPGMKGDKFLEVVSKEVPGCIKILLTGHADNEIVQKLDCCNSDDITCIYKPWDEQELLKLIN